MPTSPPNRTSFTCPTRQSIAAASAWCRAPAASLTVLLNWKAPDLVVEIVSDNSVAKDTKQLPISYWRAGIAEFWLIDVRGRRTFFRIHTRGEGGYEPVSVDGENFQRSAVFNHRFHLGRRRNARDRWVFDLQSRE